MKKIEVSVPIIAYQTWEIVYKNFPQEDESLGEELKKLYPPRQN